MKILSEPFPQAYIKKQNLELYEILCQQTIAKGYTRKRRVGDHYKGINKRRII